MYTHHTRSNEHPPPPIPIQPPAKSNAKGGNVNNVTVLQCSSSKKYTIYNGEWPKKCAKYYTKAVLLKRNLHTHTRAPRAPRFFFIRRRRRRRVLTPQPFLRIGNGIGLLLHLRWCAARLNFEDGTCHHGDEMRIPRRGLRCLHWPLCAALHRKKVASIRSRCLAVSSSVSNNIHHALHYDGNIEQLGSARRALALQSSAPRPHLAQTHSQVHFDRRVPAALVQISP